MIRVVGGRIEVGVSKIPPPFPGWTTATTIWPVILYESDDWDDECLQVHERYHWMDQLRWLVIPWFVTYLLLLPFYGGGTKHPLEREAYRREGECRSGGGD